MLCAYGAVDRVLSAFCLYSFVSAFKTVFDEETELSLLKRFVKKNRQKKSRVKGEDSTRSLKYLLNSAGFSPQVIRRYFED